MSTSGDVSLGVLAERLEGVRADVVELRQWREEDGKRLRTVEESVKTMVDLQAAARQAEARQYQKVANAIQFGALLMAAAMVALTVVIIRQHTG